MPFVTSDHRRNPDLTIPGDLCYVAYKRMVDAWCESPRWTTIDGMAKTLYPDPQERAKFLALLVFMHMIGFKYEEVKREENGDV